MNTPAASIRLLCVCTLFAWILGGCATKPVATVDSAELPFDQAIAAATDGLVSQTEKLPGFLAKLNKRGIVVDPMIDSTSGQQTVATRQIEEKVVERMRAAHPQFDMLPFQPSNMGTANYVLTGTMTRQPGANGAKASPFRINLALTELKSGNVVAQASSHARDEGIDTSPTPYYSDSPVLVKDKVVDGYARTSETPPGQPADPVYFERIGTATLVNDATVAYNDGRYQEALELYGKALATPQGEQMRVVNGVYLASWKLGRAAEAEQAFAKVVAFGLSNNNLGVKFLFKPNTTDFWPDPKVSGPYGLWLRQIARQAAASKVCMDVVGHTSRTGSETYNDKLSLQRANAIQLRLQQEAPDLNGHTHTSGKGFRENIVGTGTDDASDALDRRVEFKIMTCGEA